MIVSNNSHPSKVVGSLNDKIENVGKSGICGVKSNDNDDSKYVGQILPSSSTKF